MKEEINKIKEEQQVMKKDIKNIKREQQTMKKDMKQMKSDIKILKEGQIEIRNEQLVMKDDIRINRLNIGKILEVQNETLEYIKQLVNPNNKVENKLHIEK